MIVDPTKHNAISDASFDWLMRADRGLTPAEQAELDSWLAADIRHFGAYARAQSIFAHAKRTKALGTDFDPEQFVSRIETPSADNDYQGAPDKLSRRMFLGASGAVAASGAMFLLFATGEAAQAITYRTELGELRNIDLADGSRMIMNTGSEIKLLFSRESRSVSLIRGEVLFNVSHDPKRPFIVDATDFEVKAVGTSFAVQNFAGRAAQLVVQDGIVDVMPPRAAALRVLANTKVTISSDGSLQQVSLSQSELERELLWQEGKIAFEDTSLASAIETFKRYGGTQIYVEDPDLLKLTITGVFSSDNPVGFAKVVAEAFELTAIPEGRGIRLRKES
jgi:transmembrane sensor